MADPVGQQQEQWQTVSGPTMAAQPAETWEHVAGPAPTQSTDALAPMTAQEKAQHGPVGREALSFGSGAAQGLLTPLVHPIQTAQGLAQAVQPDQGAAGIAESLAGPAGAFITHAAKGAYDDYKQNGLSHALGSLAGGAALGEVGEAAAPAAANAAESAAIKLKPKVSNMINEHIGLQPSDLAKYQRTKPAVPEEIANTVYNKAGFHPQLDKQAAQIDQALTKEVNAQNERIKAASQSGAAKGDISGLLKQSEADLLNEVMSAGRGDDTTLRAISHNHEALRRSFNGQLSPAEMLEMKRGIKPGSFDTNTTNVGDRFRQMVYHRLNDEIETALPADQAKAFRQSNQDIKNLVIAKEAANEKLTKGAMKDNGGLGPRRVVDLASRVAQPSKYKNIIPTPVDSVARFAPSKLLGGAAKATSLAGDTNLARILVTPNLTPQAPQQ